METTLEIAGLSMYVSTPFSYELLPQFGPFHQPIPSPADITVTFHPVPSPLIWEEKPTPGDFYLPRVLLSDGHRYIGYRAGGQRCHAWTETDGRTMDCFYLTNSLKYFPTERQVFGVICLEQVLSLHHGFILHSSFIRWNGMGVVFTAPSGTGKSTQADLWEKYGHAEILNGDRTCLRCADGTWKAYGLPFAGSSAIYRNESAPLAAVVVLRQAPENRIERLSGKEAFLALYSGMTLHPWDPEFMDRALADLEVLLDQVPVYRLSCRPDKGAVDILKEKLADTRSEESTSGK